MLKASFDFREVAGKLDKLTKAAEDSVRPAAQAGAEKFYMRMKLNVSGLSGDKTLPGVVTGTLKNAVYQAYSRDNSGDGKATYHISVNKKKAPHWHLLEYGTSRMAARPFIRPTYTAVVNEAMEATKKRMLDEVKKAL